MIFTCRYMIFTEQIISFILFCYYVIKTKVLNCFLYLYFFISDSLVASEIDTGLFFSIN